MLDFFLNVQQSSGGGGAGDAYNPTHPQPGVATHAFMVPSGNDAQSGFAIWDISNPSAMTEVSTDIVGTAPDHRQPFTYRQHRTVCVKGGYAYSGGLASLPTVKVYDVTSPSTFSVASDYIGGVTPTQSNIMVAAHPTKDVLWVVGGTASSAGYVSTFDISNPASPSLISEASTITTGCTGADISHDGEYCFIRTSGTDVLRFELDSSNAPSNRTVHTNSFGSVTNNASIAYTEGASGNKYLVMTAGSQNYLAVIELDGSYSVIDSWYVYDPTNFDDTRNAVGFPYGSNYSSDDLFTICDEDDDLEFGIDSSNPASSNSFTRRVTYYYISDAYRSSSMDIQDQYVFVCKGFRTTNAPTFMSFEWSALSTFSLLDFHNASSAIEPHTTLCDKIVLYKP